MIGVTKFQQLLYSDQSITEIAYDVGYQDSNYFSTRFKSLFRVSPRDVRAGCAAQRY
ncbi:helix-turn-helix domain-containing protein [Vibrio sp. CDRSL-10 TSBA]